MTQQYRSIPLFTAALLSVFLLSSCSDPLRPPVLPQWDAEIHVPFLVQTYSAEDLIGIDSTITTSSGSNSTLILTKEIQLERIDIGQALRLDDQTRDFSNTLGFLSFDIPKAMDEHVSIRSMFPTLTEGISVVPPLINTSAIDVEARSGEYFEEMTFESGYAVFRLTNTLSIPVSFPQAAKILDGQRRLLAELHIAQVIAPGKTLELPSVPLHGLTIKNALILSILVATPGSSGVPVSINNSMSLNIQAAIKESRILSALAYIPAQSADYDERVNIITDGSRLLTGRVQTGFLNLTVRSQLPVASTFRFSLSGARLNGQDISGTVTVSANSSQTLVIPLAGAILTPVDERDLRCEIHLDTDESLSAPVRITSSDKFSISAQLASVVLDYMTGTVPPRSISIDQSRDVAISITSKLQGNLTYSNVRMWAALTNHSELPIRLNEMRISGTEAGARADIQVQQTGIPPRGMSSIPLDDDEVTRFFNSFPGGFPEKLEVHGTMSLNEERVYGSATSKDSITGTLFVEVPMSVSFSHAELIDVGEIHIDRDTRKRMTSINEGLIVLEMENHLPAGVTIEPEILDANSTILLTPKTVTGEPVHIAAGVLDNAGRVIDATRSNVQLRLEGTDVQKLLQGTFFRARVKLSSRETQPVVFRTSDFIRLRAYATITVHSDIVQK